MFFKVNKAFFLTASASIIWGATAPIMKLTLEQIPPFSLAFIRMAAASFLLGLIIYRPRLRAAHQDGAGKGLKINKDDLPTFFLSAVTGVTLNLSFFFIGLRLTEAILASFLIASVPIFTLVAAHFYLREKFTSRLILASLVALAGVILIIGKFEGGASTKQLLGNLLLLLSTISWVANEIISKKLLKTYSGGTVTFYTMAIGAATFAPLFIWELLKNPSWIANVTQPAFLGLAYGIFFASLAAYWAWNKGLKLLPAGQAAFFFYLDPVSGATLSIILLGEKLTPTLIIGGTLIALGVFLAEQKRKSHPLIRNQMGAVRPEDNPLHPS